MNDPIPPSINSPQIRTCVLAIWSLVLGILSLLCFSIFAAIPGVICGHKALSQIKRSGGSITGDGLAIGGLVTGYIGIAMALVLVPLMVAIAIPNFIHARDTAMQNACSNNLRQIDAAKQQWALENKKSGQDLPTVDDLDPYIKGGFRSLHCPAGGTYTIKKTDEAPSCSISNHFIVQTGTSNLSRPAMPPSPLSNLRSTLGQSSRPGGAPRSFVFNPAPGPGGHWPATNNPDAQAFQEKSQCWKNMFQIQSAKRAWAMRNHKQTTDVPTFDDLTPFLPGHQMPNCPAGGVYTIGAVRDLSDCSIAAHQHPHSRTNNPVFPGR